MQIEVILTEEQQVAMDVLKVTDEQLVEILTVRCQSTINWHVSRAKEALFVNKSLLDIRDNLRTTINKGIIE